MTGSFFSQTDVGSDFVSGFCGSRRCNDLDALGVTIIVELFAGGPPDGIAARALYVGIRLEHADRGDGNDSVQHSKEEESVHVTS
jgi:hypothetical protein